MKILKRFNEFLNESWVDNIRYWCRKPSTWEECNSSGIDYSEYETDLDKLEIFDVPKGYMPMDYFSLDVENKKIVPRNKEYREFTPVMSVFIVRVNDISSVSHGNTYFLINTDGYSYMRYVMKIENFNE